MSSHHPTLLHHAPSTQATGTTASRWIDADGARRLSRYGLIMAMGTLAATIFYQLMPHYTGAKDCWWLLFFWNCVVIVGGFALSLCAPGCSCGKRLLVMAAGFQLLATFVISLSYFPPTGYPDNMVVIGVPWPALIVLIFPMLVPAPPGLHAVIALLGATWIPLMYLYQLMTGQPLPPDGTLPNMVFANLMAAGIAIVAASTVYQMRRDVRRAEQRALDLGSYTLTRRIGAGGMGEVWQAEHKLLRRPAAIKLISPRGLEGEGGGSDLLSRFEREAQATARLTSSHTVEVYDFGHTPDGRFFYVMELLDGIDLEQLVDDFGPQSQERVLHILEQACLSLGEAHAHQFIHRDIKPANIFICRQGYAVDQVKVLDFGLVFGPENNSTSTRLTGLHQVTGTPGYIAPELAAGARDVTPSVDIYALGCVAFWLLTGRPVFDDPSPMKLIIRQASEPPPEITDIVKVPLSNELADLIMACIHSDPAKRPASTCEVLARLAECPRPQPWHRLAQTNWWRQIPPMAERATGTVCHVGEKSAPSVQAQQVEFA